MLDYSRYSRYMEIEREIDPSLTDAGDDRVAEMAISRLVKDPGFYSRYIQTRLLLENSSLSRDARDELGTAPLDPNPAQSSRAADSMLVAIPETSTGACCGNCTYFTASIRDSNVGQCFNSKVNLPVLIRNHCMWWENKAAKPYGSPVDLGPETNFLEEPT